MPLQFAHGAVQWLAADAATTNYVVTGVGFQPKAMRFYWMGLGSAADTASQTTHSRRGVGFATSTSDRRCVGSQDQDAAPAMVCTSGFREDCVAMTLTSTPAADGLLDITAFGTDGFTLTVDDQAPVNITVFWEAWGGSAITNAVTGVMPEPAATGPQEYTTGFRPDIVMTAGVQTTSAAPAATRNDSGLSAGFGFTPGGLNAVFVVGNSDDGSGNADTDSEMVTSSLLDLHGMITTAGGVANAFATADSRSSTSFTLNWGFRAVTNRRNIYMAIAGGQWSITQLTINATSIGNTASVSNLSFVPIGLCVQGLMTSAIRTTEDRMSFGTASSPTSRRAQGHWSENGTGSAEIDLAIEYDQVLVFPSNAGGVLTALDVDLMTSTGYRLIVDVAGGSTADRVNVVAFGNPRKPTPLRTFPLRIGA